MLDSYLDVKLQSQFKISHHDYNPLFKILPLELLNSVTYSYTQC